MDFAPFDARNYRTLDVQDGYSEWAETYEATVEDEMDLRLFERITTVDWAASRHALDLACGTGRIGMWLRSKGVLNLDGVDFTAEMLDRAKSRGVYRSLLQADIRDTGLPAASYDLITQSLADEHLPDLRPLYCEVSRLSHAGGLFVMVGYHSHFLMNGIPTHFDHASGQSVAVESYVHLLSDHVKAAHTAGFVLLEMDEGIVDDAWLAKKPKWKRFFHHPISFSIVWRREK